MATWYALYTAPRAEKKVYDRLILNNIEAFLPLHKSKRKWSDRIKIVELPLFTSYIFVKCENLEDLLKIRYLIYGIINIVYYCNKPAIIREDEIEAIKLFLSKAEGKKLICGEDAKIIIGPFENMTGQIIRTDTKKTTLVLKELGISVTIESDSLE